MSADKVARAASALRANIARRKAQKRARDAQDDAAPAVRDPADTTEQG